MKQQLIVTIRDQALWEPGDRVAIAVSGGADSVALASLLHATRGVHRAALSLVTVDHGLHPDSPAWVERVVRLGDRLQLPVRVERIEVVGDSEAAARQARYAALDALPVDRVALAHHRQDQAETVLINLLRGTQGPGLAGMRFRRGRYVRPLLDVEPRALREWCTSQSLDWVEDPANQAQRYLRVGIRERLLPLLETLRPGAVGSLARVARGQREDQDLLEALAADLPLTVDHLEAAPPSLRRRRIRQWLEPVTHAVVDEVDALVRRGKGTVDVGGGRTCSVVNGQLVLGGPSTR